MQLTKTFQVATICTIVAALTGCASSDAYFEESYAQESSSVRTEASGSGWTSTSASAQQQYSAPQQGTTQRQTASQSFDQDQIVIPLHEEKLNIGKRTVETGQVRVRKIVTTETVSQPIELRKESVVIERMPAGAQSTAQTSNARSGSAQFNGSSQAFQEEDLTITIREEQPVVEKRVVVGDQFTARKNTDTERVNVERQVRREEIQLDQSGDTAAIEIRGFDEAAGAERPQSPEQKRQDDLRQQDEYSPQRQE